jgi:Arc/MetJ family transcription regulator
MNLASDKKVADITLGELQEIIREIILETFDPDYGLALREEVVEALRESLEQKERGEGISLQEAKNRLGIK